MSIRRTFKAQPTSEEVLKKVELAIVNDAKSEEKNLKHIVKDLTAAEKATQKAHKVIGVPLQENSVLIDTYEQAVDKAEHKLHNAEKKECDTLKVMHMAEHKHDDAVSTIHMTQNDLEVEVSHSFPFQ